MQLPLDLAGLRHRFDSGCESLNYLSLNCHDCQANGIKAGRETDINTGELAVGIMS